MSVVSNGNQNRILALLTADEARQLAPRLEPVALEYRQVLCAPGERIEHIYFPTSGVVSWLTPMDAGASVEVATIGREGIVGFRALLGAGASTAKVMVQVPGNAWRMNVADAKTAMKPGSTLVHLLHSYINAFVTQITQSVACNTFHSVEKRFCRWLLMTHDRVQSDQFPLTHELLAQMLGVRRASVTVVARKLQKAGLIRYTHGKITILDRPGLEAASCGCYAIVKADYDELLSGRMAVAPNRG